MRRSLVVFLAMVPAAGIVGTSAPAAPAKYPAGEVVFRPECFGGYAEEGRVGSSGPSGGQYGYGAVPRTSAPYTAPLPAPAPIPTQPGGTNENSYALDDSDLAPTPAPSPKPSPPAKSKNTPSVHLGLGAKKAPQSAAPPPAAEPAVTSVETTSTAGRAAGKAGGKPKDQAAAEEVAFEPMEAPPADLAKSELKEVEKTVQDGEAQRSFDRREDAPTPDTNRARGPVLDWGATVYLSNDDSMSLASAQRLLYATMNQLPFTLPQIRPHELLNYFSFDAVNPSADQMFDVLASAEQDGDKLSVALAVKGGTPPRQDLDLTLVVDRSCSMDDEGRMDYTKRGLDLMSQQLRTGDRLDVVLFDDRVCVPLENYVVGRDDPKLLQQTIAMMRPEGSTDVGLGLRTAYDVVQRHLDTHDRNRRVMLVTDALMNTGDVDPNTVSEIGRAYEQQGVRLTGVGVGSEFDDKVLDLLTEKGKGAYVFLGSEAVVDRVFGETGFPQLTQTIAHDVHFALKLPQSLAMERFYGEEASTVMEDVQPVNYFAGTTQLFLQDLVLKNGKVVGTDPVLLEITYRNARTGEPETRTFKTTVGTMVEADPHNVRKGLALMAWTDLLTAQAMGSDPCGAPLQSYASRAGKVADDAEIAFVNGLVSRQCGSFDLPALVSNKGVPFKVRVDADIPVSEVAISCRGSRSSETLSGSDVIAMFTVQPGVCDLTLSGNVDMTAQVEVPTTGGDLRCTIRGGRLSCS